jgi:hypothetical protein
MERFFDGTDQENSKTQGGKGQIRKIKKKQEGKEWMKEKEEIFAYVKVPLTGVFSIHREHPRATALMRPSLRGTHLYWNLPYNQVF